MVVAVSETTPPMPTTQAEWEAHWALYRLTVHQRDAAWSEVTNLRQMVDRLVYLFNMGEEELT